MKPALPLQNRECRGSAVFGLGSEQDSECDQGYEPGWGCERGLGFADGLDFEGARQFGRGCSRGSGYLHDWHLEAQTELTAASRCPHFLERLVSEEWHASPQDHAQRCHRHLYYPVKM